MKLTEKQEAEIWQVYDTWLFSYLNGDVKTYDSFLDDEYHFIGSATKEEFLNRKDTTQFFADTGDQFAGKTEIRNESKIIEQFGELIIITHVFDAWFLHEKEWNFYSRFRFSSTLRKNKDGWRFIYQHFSIPDPKTAEGETIGYDKINEENQELREAIQRRTIELEQKNRELEVEGSLDRISAQAVAMKEPSDLLDIVVTMRNEFIMLGHEAHYFWHMMWLPEKYEKAMTSGDGTKIGFVMELPRHIHGNIPQLAKWEKSNKSTIVYAMNVEEALEYIDKMVSLGDFQNIDPQAPTEDDIRHIGGLTFVMARTSYGEIGYSLPGIVKNPPKEDVEILVRFAGAFDLAHQRFIDLQKAEAQAREAQIEAALERVRSRTMAMQHSDELQEASFLLDQQVRVLGIKTWGCAFNIYGENESTEWFGNEKGVLPTYSVPHKGIFKEYYQKGQKGESFFIKEFSGKACVDHYEYMSTLPVIGDVLRKLKKSNNGFPTYQIDHIAYFKYGYLLFITKEHVPDAHDVFKRFAKVFDQTYTRFLDLQKAEVQAREAEIESALERLRGASMSMHNTEDLFEVVLVYFDQLKKLNIEFVQSWITIFHIEEGYVDVWFSPLEGVYKDPKHFKMPSKLFENTSVKSWKKGLPFSHISLTSKVEVNQFMKVCDDVTTSDYFMTIQKKLQLEQLELLDANNKYGCISKSNVVKATKEEEEILQRFSKVFEQTYTRFLDLQKAEKQAREAQIEAGLERVRAASMAMHQTNELKEVIQVIFNQLGLLNINAEHAGIVVDFKAKQDWTFWIAETQDIPSKITMPYLNTLWDRQYTKAKEKGNDFFTTQLNFDEKNKFYDKLLRHIPGLTKKAEDFYFKCAGLAISTVVKDDIGLYIENFSGTPYSEYENDILKRFGKVFQQAYTRFLDLQKAEEQAREAQIEAALERVRSASMAMHKSDELIKVATIVYDQVLSLGFDSVMSGGFNFPDEDRNIQKCWFAETEHFGLLQDFEIPLSGDSVLDERIEYHKKGIPFLEQVLIGDEVRKHMEFVFPVDSASNDEAESRDAMPDPTVFTIRFLNTGYMIFISTEVLSDDQKSIIERFANGFNLAYTRFLDLQKAEEQAREAQIEAALERVRSRSMAMHHPSELQDVIHTVYQQYMQLNIEITGGVFIAINDENKETLNCWGSGGTTDYIQRVHIPFMDIPIYTNFIESIQKGPGFFTEEFTFEEKIEFFTRLFQNPPYNKTSKEHREEVMARRGGYTRSCAVSKHSTIFVISHHGHIFSQETNDILVRFGKVFEQAYTRFLDLKKAESQAREAQIEAALERVRSQSMGMQSSTDLANVTTAMFEQLRLLGGDLFATGIVFCDKHEGHVEQWHSLPKAGMMSPFIVPIDLDYIHQYRYDEWKKGTELFSIEIPSDFIEQHFNDIFNLPSAQKVLKDFEDQNTPMPDTPPWEIDYGASFKYGYILASSLQHFEDAEILPRFAKVFEQTYTRFLDLEKAEAQAREAQIEASLERVRARAMAMHQTDELTDVLCVLFDQFDILGINPVLTHLTLFDQENETFSLRITSTAKKRIVGEQFIDINAVEAWKNSFENWKKSEPNAINCIDYEPEVLPMVWELLNEVMEALPKGYKIYPKDFPNGLYTTQGHFKFGYIGFNHTRRATEEEKDIVVRFAKEFGRTYQRFLDLKKVEKQAREAQIEAALERVRARALAMHNPEELKEVAQVLRTEMGLLGVEELETSSIYINDSATDKTECWYAIKDIRSKKKKLINDHFELELKDTWVGRKMLKFYKSKNKTTSIVMTGKNRKEWTDYCETHSKPFEGYYGEEIPDRTYHLYKFSYGAIGVATPTDISKESWNLLKRAAAVFSLAYSRFKDLTQARYDLQLLKEEKKRAEDALSELQATQNLLIQSEKMASLGELTAGIAHEIQNPLNFVNNFSEVSKELLEEMLEEMENGDMEEVKAIMDDVVQNLDKINHHGNRADGIVKGMLQHSRASGDKKEPTDINNLADEYMRLAYHGLRAKDKSFNATLETDFDENLKNVDVIPQDIGRVILNLFTNAFYEVSKKKNLIENTNYKPTVSVSTKMSGKNVIIGVRDNANGIPKKVIDKIFQPFFTTKPTGQGTGLGLSMSYDIIKAHNGELTVDTKTGEFTEFTIKLPV